MNPSLNKAVGQETYQASEARRPALEGEQPVFPPDQGLSLLQAQIQAGLQVGIVGCSPWYSGSQLQWLCGAEPQFSFPVTLQHLFFLMSLVVLETEEKILPDEPFCYHQGSIFCLLAKQLMVA